MPKRYERIADDLRRMIRSGELAPGEQIPTEDDLKKRYSTSPGTVQAAKRELETEGLIDNRPGKGSFVRPPRRQVRRKGGRHQWEKDRVHLVDEERGKTGAVEHDTGLEFPDIEFHASYNAKPAGGHLAALFGVDTDTKMLHRYYMSRSLVEDAPVSIINSWLVWDMVARNPDLLNDAKEPWAGGTQHQLFTVGIELDQIVEEITARPPRPEEAEMLNIGQGISVLLLRKTSIDIRGRVVEYSEVVMPGDRTVIVYTTQLQRWSE
jgi:GntR family transcriptional regulator